MKWAYVRIIGVFYSPFLFEIFTLKFHHFDDSFIWQLQQLRLAFCLNSRHTNIESGYVLWQKINIYIMCIYVYVIDTLYCIPIYNLYSIYIYIYISYVILTCECSSLLKLLSPSNVICWLLGGLEHWVIWEANYMKLLTLN